MMHTWLSYRDLTDLVRRGLFTPGVGHTVVYGASDNRDGWWDNSGAAILGYVPQDSSEPFRAEVERQPRAAGRRSRHGLSGWRLHRRRSL